MSTDRINHMRTEDFQTPEDFPMDALNSHAQPMDIPVEGGILKVFPDNSSIMIPSDGNMQQAPKEPEHFNGNIIHFFSKKELEEMGLTLKKAVDDDFDSRKPYIEGVTETLKQTKMDLATQGPSDTGSFKHASDVNSLALQETTMLITLSGYQQLYGGSEICDTAVWGDETPETVAARYRVKNYTNIFLKYETPEFKAESKKIMLYATTAGSAHSKIYLDPVRNMPIKVMIPIGNFVVHKDYASQSGSMRKTHVEYITREEFRIRQEVGYYAKDDEDPTFAPSGEYLAPNLERQLEKMKGVIHMSDQEDADKEIAMSEIRLYRHYDQDPAKRQYGQVAPYIVTQNKTTGKISGIYRNWRQGDPQYKEKRAITSWILFPSYEGEGYGLANMCGNQARAATGVSRLIADAATYANIPCFLYPSGMSIQESEIRLVPGQGYPIPAVDGNLKDSVIFPPFRNAAQDVFMLRDSLEASIKRLGGTFSSQLLDLPANTPATTTLAIMDQSEKIPNAILSSWFDSAAEELDILRECFFDWMQPGEQQSLNGPQGNIVVTKEDFSGHIRLIPNGDPNVHNTTAMLIQAQMILSNAQAFPQYHNLPSVLELTYQAINLAPEKIKSLLAPQPSEAMPLDPGTENSNMETGVPVVAADWQDHQAHVTVHSIQLNNPNPEVVARAQAHISDHNARMALLQLQAQSGVRLPPNPAEIPPEMQNEIAMAMAQAVMQQQQQQQAQTPPPIDPALVAMQEIKQQGEIAAMKNKTDLLKIRGEQDKYANEAALKEQDLRMRREMDMMRLELENKKLQLDMMSKDRDAMRQQMEGMKKNSDKQMSR